MRSQRALLFAVPAIMCALVIQAPSAVATTACPTGFDFVAGSSTVCEKRITNSQTWVIPAGVTSVDMVLVGGGGGGGGSGGNSAAGGGGGGGGQSRGAPAISLADSTSIEIVVGTGGAGGAGGAAIPGTPGIAGFAGSTGGTTTVTVQPSAVSYQAAGGAGGGGATATQVGGAGGAGGTGGPAGASNGGAGGIGDNVNPRGRAANGGAGPIETIGLFAGNVERFGGGGGGGGSLRGAAHRHGSVIGAGGAGGGGAGGPEVPLTTPASPGNPGNPGSAPGGGGGGGTGPSDSNGVAGGRGGQGADGVVLLRVSAFSAARIPIFDVPVATPDGFTVNVTNYDANFTWTATATIGTVTIGDPHDSVLPLLVTGLPPGASTTVTTTTNRVGYAAGSAEITAAAEDGNALIPTFDAAKPTTDGFTVNVTNYDANFTWTATATIGTVTIGDPLESVLPLIVTDLTPGASATLTVVTTRPDYQSGTSSLVGQARRSPAEEITTPLPTPQSVALDPGNGNSCHSAEMTALTGTWINLPTANACVADAARSASTLLGWATTPAFPIEFARRQVANGWGAYEIFDASGRLSAVFIPAGGATLISSDGTLHAIWGN